MKYLILIICLLIAPNVHALNEVDRAEIFSKNLLLNGGFENGKAKWTASAGTFTTTGSSPMVGKMHATWDAAASGNTLTSKVITIPAGMHGRNGVASCLFTTASGTATHTIQAYDGTNVLSSVAITSSTTPTRASANFIFPSSVTVALRIYANADEPSVAIDDCFLGPAESFNLGLDKPQDVFSATIANDGTVTNENSDWISGNCTNADPRVCTFVTSFFSAAPNCTTDGEDVTAVSSSSVSVDQNAVITRINCQKTGTDALQAAYRPDIAAWRVDANISGANISLGTSAQSAYVTPNNASLTLTQNTGSSSVGISCSSTNDNSVGSTTCSAGSEEPGIVVDIPRAGHVEVCFDFSHYVNHTTLSGDLTSTFEVQRTSNGSQTIAENGKSRISSGGSYGASASFTYFNPHTLCGRFNITSAAKHTFRLMYEQGTLTGTSNLILADAAASYGQRDIHVTARYIDQSVPAPLLVGSVVSNSSGVLKEIIANLNCDAGSAITSQTGSTSNGVASIGNVSGGACAVTLASGTFSTTPYCWATPNAAFASAGLILSAAASSSTAISVDCEDDASGACTSYDFNLLCKGAP